MGDILTDLSPEAMARAIVDNLYTVFVQIQHWVWTGDAR
jgi:hypothetical protein